MRNGILFIAILVFASCKEPIDKNFETVIGNYKIGYLNASKPNENILVYCTECKEMMAVMVRKRIKRLGFNERYLVIERTGNFDDVDRQSIDSLTTTYYILDMEKEPNVFDKEYYFGPVDIAEFEAKKEELGIGGLKFTKEFRVNEPTQSHVK